MLIRSVGRIQPLRMLLHRVGRLKRRLLPHRSGCVGSDRRRRRLLLGLVRVVVVVPDCWRRQRRHRLLLQQQRICLHRRAHGQRPHRGHRRGRQRTQRRVARGGGLHRRLAVHAGRGPGLCGPAAAIEPLRDEGRRRVLRDCVPHPSARARLSLLHHRADLLPHLFLRVGAGGLDVRRPDGSFDIFPGLDQRFPLLVPALRLPEPCLRILGGQHVQARRRADVEGEAQPDDADDGAEEH
mmetsp:Transcript_168532/g.541660  ORF Transcript_168532/g.541660 Transcript_168532/m.541660 type:complete len:239 (+) Transcript_168532:857-1573(+)